MSGTTTYSTSRPTVPYTSSTTEFEDSLITSTPITLSQCLLNKGVPVEDLDDVIDGRNVHTGDAVDVEARRRIEKKREQRREREAENEDGANANDDHDHDDKSSSSSSSSTSSSASSSSSLLNSLPSYTASRLEALKTLNSGVLNISKSQWYRTVVCGSERGRVVVVMLGWDGDDDVLNWFREMSSCNPSVAFVRAHYKDVVSGNYPLGNMPTFFFYKDGECARQSVKFMGGRDGLERVLRDVRGDQEEAYY